MDIRTPQHRGPSSPDPNTIPNGLQSVLMSLGKSTMNLERLQAENALLRAQLNARSPNNATLGTRDMLLSPAASSQEMSIVDTVPLAQYEALLRQHEDLKANHARLEGQHEFVRKKWKESKACIKEWQAYTKDKRERKTGKASKPGSVSTPPPAEIEQNHDSEVTPRASAVTRERGTAHSNDAGNSPIGIDSSPLRLSVLPDRTASQTKQTKQQVRRESIETGTSSQTTVVDAEDQDDVPDQVQAAPSSDFEPIVVSTRSLKRKIGSQEGLHSPVRRIKQEPGSPSTPIELPSSPKRTRIADVATSSDDCLDNFGPAMATPRRPKRVIDLRIRATSEEAVRMVPRLQRSSSSLSEGDADALSDLPTSFVPELNRASSGGPRRSGNASAGLVSRSSQRHAPEPLKPISGNIFRLPRTPEVQSKPRAKVRRTGVKDKILLVSEDGDGSSSQTTTRMGQDPAGLPVDARLYDLLNGPSPDRTPVLPRLLAPAESTTKNQSRPASSHLRTPISVVKRTSPVKPATNLRRSPVRPKSPASGKFASALGRAAFRGKSPPLVRPEEEPLRIRPVATLRLEDFKVNPKYMGTDFAFADTLRGRDARRNLHVCTRMDCCGGALQTVMQMGGSGTAASGKTNHQALKEYLGPEWESLVGAQKMGERERTLLQAHAFCFANEHGKHRSAFERRSTPPGYWRADFPTTQEQVIDKKTADEMQKKEVEDRRREAMREGGRWMFRDE